MIVLVKLIRLHSEWFISAFKKKIQNYLFCGVAGPSATETPRRAFIIQTCGFL